MPKKNEFLQIIAVQLSRLDAARTRLLNGQDVEALHDFRVALRSLRSLLPIVLKRSKRLDGRILAAWKALAQFTGPTRDAEVLLSLVGEQMSASQRAALAVTHREGLAAISAALMGPDFAQLAHISLQQCRLRIEACAPVLLQRRIKLQAKDYENCLDQAAGNESPTLEQWHERRLIIKQLRYLSLLAAKWLPNRVNQLQIPLKQAQTAIGKLHDAELIAQFLHKKKVKKPLIRKAYKAWNKLMFQRKIEFMVLG